MCATLHVAFVTRRAGPSGAADKTVVLSHTPVSCTQHRVIHEGLRHRYFEVVEHRALGYPTSPLKRMPVQSNPGRYFLIKDHFGVLVTTVAHLGHKDVGPAARPLLGSYNWPTEPKSTCVSSPGAV